MPKPAIEKDFGGTITLTVPESGEITDATAIVYDARGEHLADPAVTVLSSPARLSFSILGEQAATLGENYRVQWTYSVAGATVRHHQLFDVVRAVVLPPLTQKEQLFRKYPLFEGREFPGVHLNDLGFAAWVELGNRVQARGKNINLLVDASPLEDALAALWASRVAENYRPGGPQSNAWQEQAARLDAKCDDLLDKVFANLAWYDADQDLKPTTDEENVNVGTIFLTR